MTFNKFAFILGTMIGADWITENEVKTRLLQAAVKCGLDHNKYKRRLDDPKGPIAKGMEKPATAEDAPCFAQISAGLQFVERCAGEMRYVSERRKWMHWDGARWTKDKTELGFDLVAGICREIALEVASNGGKGASTIAGAPFINGVEKIARTNRLIAAAPDIWDTNQWLLNTPRGVVDLRTGERRDARPEDCMTKTTMVAPDASCSIAIWLSALDRSMGGDQEMVDYLQRCFGYGLTGSVRDEKLAFWIGAGGNGKTKIAEASHGAWATTPNRR